MKLNHRVTAILWGFGGTLLAMLLVAALWTATVTVLRARNGEAAWECLHSPACLQSALQSLQRPPEKR